MNTTESPTPTSDRTTPEIQVDTQPAGTTSLDFRAIRETHSATWAAALEAETTVTDGARPDLFVVDAGDGLPANCSLARTPDGHAGWCSCPSFDASGVCPHLCVLRQRASVNMLTLPHRQE